MDLLAGKSTSCWREKELVLLEAFSLPVRLCTLTLTNMVSPPPLP